MLFTIAGLAHRRSWSMLRAVSDESIGASGRFHGGPGPHARDKTKGRLSVGRSAFALRRTQAGHWTDYVLCGSSRMCCVFKGTVPTTGSGVTGGYAESRSRRHAPRGRSAHANTTWPDQALSAPNIKRTGEADRSNGGIKQRGLLLSDHASQAVRFDAKLRNTRSPTCTKLLHRLTWCFPGRCTLTCPLRKSPVF